MLLMSEIRTEKKKFPFLSDSEFHDTFSWCGLKLV